MITTQLSLTEVEAEMLRAMAERSGKTQEELLREGLDLLIARFTSQDRRTLLGQARGIWRDRDDLSRLPEMREELNRFQSGLR